MEISHRIAARKSVNLCLIAAGMETSLHLIQNAAFVFGDIDFTATRPACRGKIRSQHPQRGPEPHARGEFGAKLEPSVLFPIEALRLHARRSVVEATYRLLPGLDMEQAVAHVSVLRAVRVVLELVIAPAIIVPGLEGPISRIDGSSVELIAPHDIPGGLGHARPAGLAQIAIVEIRRAVRIVRSLRKHDLVSHCRRARRRHQIRRGIRYGSGQHDDGGGIRKRTLVGDGQVKPGIQSSIARDVGPGDDIGAVQSQDIVRAVPKCHFEPDHILPVNAAAVARSRIRPAIGRVNCAGRRRAILVYARIIVCGVEQTIDFEVIRPAAGRRARFIVRVSSIPGPIYDGLVLAGQIGFEAGVVQDVGPDRHTERQQGTQQGCQTRKQRNQRYSITMSFARARREELRFGLNYIRSHILILTHKYVRGSRNL